MNKVRILNTIKSIPWKTLGCIFLFGVFLLLANYSYISYASNSSIYTEMEKTSKTSYGLLLGTPKYLPNRVVNNYYKNRITASIELYQNQKISTIIISADTLNKYKENEVRLIHNDLIANGVSTKSIVWDKQGNSTWNSLEGAKRWIKDNDTVVVISQHFHLERALYIAREKGIPAVGYAAKGGMSNQLTWRELLARVKMQIDILKN